MSPEGPRWEARCLRRPKADRPEGGEQRPSARPPLQDAAYAALTSVPSRAPSLPAPPPLEGAAGYSACLPLSALSFPRLLHFPLPSSDESGSCQLRPDRWKSGRPEGRGSAPPDPRHMCIFDAEWLPEQSRCSEAGKTGLRPRSSLLLWAPMEGLSCQTWGASWRPAAGSSWPWRNPVPRHASACSCVHSSRAASLPPSLPHSLPYL